MVSRINGNGKPLVLLTLNARHVQHGHHLATIRVKDGGRRTAKLRVPAAKMLVTMHQHRTLLGNGCSNPVGAFRLLRPKRCPLQMPQRLNSSALDSSPAVMNSNSIAVAKENDVAVRTNDGIEAGQISS